MTYFKGVRTVEELKRQYRKLVLQYHPDRGGSEDDMKRINLEYDILLRRVGNIHEGRDGDTWEDKSGPQDRHSCNIDDLDDGFRKVIDILLTLDGLEILLVGEWLWISGNTRDHKETLKGIGCKWSGKRQMWYWHKPDKRRRASKESFAKICSRYGAQSVTGGDHKEECRKIA